MLSRMEEMCNIKRRWRESASNTHQVCLTCYPRLQMPEMTPKEVKTLAKRKTLVAHEDLLEGLSLELEKENKSL